MALTAPTQKQSNTISQRSKATITALSPLFTTVSNQPSITEPYTLWTAIQTAYATALATFALPQVATAPLSHPSAPTRVTNAVFDTDAELFFEGPHSELFGSLSKASKARLLAQGVSGVVLFFGRLAGVVEAGEVVSEGVFERELEGFRGGEEREAAMNGVEGSSVWEGCASGEEVARLVGRVVDRAGDEVEVAGMVEGELEGAMGFDVERPRNMGLPWGFSILPVN